MIRYRYTARSTAGERVRGALTAPDPQTAIAILRERALFVTAIQRERAWRHELRLRLVSSSGRAPVAFFRAFATLVRAGVPLRRAILIAIERTDDGALAEALRDVLSHVERGDALSVALGRHPHEFPALVVAMIAAGETGGILDEVLERVAIMLERDHALRKSVMTALAYPATVLAAALSLTVFLIVRVVPMFAGLFASFRVDLPAPTRFLLWLGAALAQPGPWIVLGVLAATIVVAGAFVQRTRVGRRVLDRLRMRTPIVGPLLRKTIHARFARMLATLIDCGIELSRALDVLAPVTGSAVHSEALARIVLALRHGEPLARPVAAERLFDPLFVALVAVGEETGRLDSMLATTAEYFESDVAATIATLGAVIEPLLIVVLGIVVGFLVYSVFLPLYTQNTIVVTLVGIKAVPRRSATGWPADDAVLPLTLRTSAATPLGLRAALGTVPLKSAALNGVWKPREGTAPRA